MAIDKLKILNFLGLSDNEAKFYLVGLRFSVATIPKLARETGISRATGYKLAEALADKGLAYRSPKGYKEQIVMAPPYKLLSIFDKKKASFEKLNVRILELVEDLKQKYKKEKPTIKIKYFEGKYFYKNVLDDALNTLKPGEELLNFSSVEAVASFSGKSKKYIEGYAKRRAEGGIRLKVIVEDTPYGRKFVEKNNEKLLRQVKLARLGLTAEINIYANKVAVALPGQDFFGFIIESEEFTDNIKKLFNFIWNLI